MAMGVTAYTAAAKDTNMVLDKIRNTFPGIPMQDITTSTLRAEQVITDSDSTYEFIFNVNRRTGTTIQPTEILLDQNNIFIPYSVEMYLAAVDATKPSAVRLQTYPNNQVFATEAGGTIYDYYIFYNSLLSIKTGKETNPPISTHYFLKMPITAQSSATTNSDNESGRPELWLSELPFFFGLANQSVFLNTTTFAGIDVAADTSGWDTRIVLILNGFIIYNGTDYANSDVQKNSPELYNAIVQAKNAGSLSF